MSEQFKHDDFLPQAHDEQNVVALIKQLQKQLVFLEKKIDILIEKSAQRPSGDRPFSRPFRSFDRTPRPYDRARGDAPGRHFEKRGDSREGNFARRNDSPREGFDPRKKPFPYKRRDRA